MSDTVDTPARPIKRPKEITNENHGSPNNKELHQIRNKYSIASAKSEGDKPKQQLVYHPLIICVSNVYTNKTGQAKICKNSEI